MHLSRISISLCLLLASALTLGGCAAGSIAGAALQLVGLGKPAAAPEQADAQKPPRNVNIDLHAGANLNAESGGAPLALVLRIYKLRQKAAFEQAPYNSFLNPQKEKETLGADLLEVKEVLLIPGQRYQVSEKVSREAYFIGVVALFRAPAARHWRVAFGAADAESAGITLGLHACALSNGADTVLATPVACP